MKKQDFYRVIATVAMLPFAVAGAVLLFSGVLLKAAGCVCLLDIAAAKYEIRRIR